MKIFGYFLMGMVGIAGIGAVEKNAEAGVTRTLGDVTGDGVVNQYDADVLARARAAYSNGRFPTSKPRIAVLSYVPQIFDKICTMQITYDVAWGTNFEGQDASIYDLNGDSNITSIDTRFMERILENCQKKSTPGPTPGTFNVTRLKGDITGDGLVNSDDSRQLFRAYTKGFPDDYLAKGKKQSKAFQLNPICETITYVISSGYKFEDRDLTIYDINDNGKIDINDVDSEAAFVGAHKKDPFLCNPTPKPSPSPTPISGSGSSNSGGNTGGSNNSGDLDTACKSTAPTITANANGSNRIDVRWSPTPGATSYQLHWKNETSTSGMSMEVAAGAPSTSLINLVKNTSYVIKAKVFRCNGRIVDAPYSTPQTIRTAP